MVDEPKPCPCSLCGHDVTKHNVITVESGKYLFTMCLDCPKCKCEDKPLTDSEVKH